MVDIVGMPGYGRSAKPDYTSYVDYLESLGWRRSQITLDEKNTRIVTTFNVAVGTTGQVVDVRCPAGQKLSIMGVQQVPAGQDARSAHALRVRFAGTADVEINQLTKIRITKEKTTEDVVQLARPFYQDINLIKQKVIAGTAAGALATDLFKDDSLWYRFKQGIELNGEEHLFIYVVGESNDGFIMPDVSINLNHVKFSLDCDLWTS